MVVSQYHVNFWVVFFKKKNFFFKPNLLIWSNYLLRKWGLLRSNLNEDKISKYWIEQQSSLWSPGYLTLFGLRGVGTRQEALDLPKMDFLIGYLILKLGSKRKHSQVFKRATQLYPVRDFKEICSSQPWCSVNSPLLCPFFHEVLPWYLHFSWRDL